MNMIEQNQNINSMYGTKTVSQESVHFFYILISPIKMHVFELCQYLHTQGGDV